MGISITECDFMYRIDKAALAIRSLKFVAIE